MTEARGGRKERRRWREIIKLKIVSRRAQVGDFTSSNKRQAWSMKLDREAERKKRSGNNWEVKFEISFHHINSSSMESEELRDLAEVRCARCLMSSHLRFFFSISFQQSHRGNADIQHKKMWEGAADRPTESEDLIDFAHAQKKRWQNNWIPSTLWSLIINFHFRNIICSLFDIRSLWSDRLYESGGKFLAVGPSWRRHTQQPHGNEIIIRVKFER